MKASRARAGQSLVEFALILPFIILLIVAFIEVARIIYYYSALENAVREGARHAIVSQYGTNTARESDVKATVIGYAVALSLSPDDISVYCEGTTTPNKPCANTVTVSADIEVEPMIGFFAQILGAGNTYHIQAESTMRMTPWGSTAP